MNVGEKKIYICIDKIYIYMYNGEYTSILQSNICHKIMLMGRTFLSPLYSFLK